MAIMNDARSALQNGASTVLSNVRHNKTTRRVLPANAQEMLKQLDHRISARRTARRVPVVPIVIAVSLAAVGTIGGILASRYFAARNAGEEAEGGYEEVEVVELVTPADVAIPE